MTKQDFNKLRTKYEEKEKKLKNDITNQKQFLLSKDEKKERETVLKQLYIEIKERIDNATYEEKEKIIHLFITSITLFADSNYANVVFEFPNNIRTETTSKHIPENIKTYPLVLRIETVSEYERQVKHLKSNTLLFREKIVS